MVDKDYAKSQTTADIIKLSEDLEDVMRKIGWRGRSNKITIDETYHTVAKAMKNDPISVRNSEIDVVFDKALTKIDVNTSKIWK